MVNRGVVEEAADVLDLDALLTGGFALVFPPKPTIVVTYRRVGSPSH
jgi:hypothetical protein